MTPDCRTCGICCASLEHESETIADVEQNDLTHLGRRLVRLHIVREQGTKSTWKRQAAGPLAGNSACVCSALSGSLLHQVRCTIYEVRPRMCREFEAGSRRCLEARREAQRILEDLA